MIISVYFFQNKFVSEEMLLILLLTLKQLLRITVVMDFKMNSIVAGLKCDIRFFDVIYRFS